MRANSVSMFNRMLLQSFNLVYVPTDRGGPSHLQPSKQKKINLMAEQRADNQQPAGIIHWEPWMSSQIYVSLLWADAGVTYLLVWTVGGIETQWGEEEKISYVTALTYKINLNLFLFKSLFPIMKAKMCGVLGQVFPLFVHYGGDCNQRNCITSSVMSYD